jgi:hypothetical protein
MLILKAIAEEFSNLDKQDVAAAEIADRLVSLKPALAEWSANKGTWPTDRSKMIQAQAAIHATPGGCPGACARCGAVFSTQQAFW